MPKLGIDPKVFWDRSNELAKEQHGDPIPTYMYQMLHEANHARISMRKVDWEEHGRGISLFPGVASWFDRINAAGVSRGIDVHHYVISSGLHETVDGTIIQKYFKAVFASAFLYDGSGVADGKAVAVNYTTRIQYLFRINKNAMDLSDDKAVNAFQVFEKRAIPFPNIVFIGDGDTDIPYFRLIKKQGGHSIAVYPAGDPIRAERGLRLITDGRVHCAVLADYTESGDLERRVVAIFDLVAKRAIITAPVSVATL